MTGHPCQSHSIRASLAAPIPPIRASAAAPATEARQSLDDSASRGYGIRLVKRFFLEEKHPILEEDTKMLSIGFVSLIKFPNTYYYWKKALGYSKRRSFTEEERHPIVEDAIRRQKESGRHR